MLRAALSALALAACSTSQPVALDETSASARVDHVIVAVSDLERGMAEIEQLTGVRPVVGGVHPGRGTRNALMSLGEGAYFELLAPDPGQAVDNEELRELRALTRPTPVGWAVSADNETTLRSVLNSTGVKTTPAIAGSRRKPDGSLLRWVTFGYDGFEHPLAPFFIIWADPSLHPSRTSPSGCQLQDLRIEDTNADELRRAVDPFQLRVSIGHAPVRRMHIALNCPGGIARLG